MTDTAIAPQQTTAEEGSRTYTVGDEEFWSVTTATSIIDKPALQTWAAGLAATTAYTELPTVVAAARRRPCGRTTNRCGHDWRITCDRCPCRTCKACITKWVADRHIRETTRRSNEGSRTHEWIEQWVLSGGVEAPHEDDITPYVAAFLAFVAEYGLTPDSWLMTEAIVISRAERYAGTTDGVIRFAAIASPAAAELAARALSITVDQAMSEKRHVDLVVDFKTREKLDAAGKPDVRFFPEQALQIAGYRHAPVAWIRRLGLEEPMPDTDGGLLVQLNPAGATPRLVVCDEATHEAFILALRLFEWVNNHGTAAVSTRSFPLPKPKAKPAAKPRNRAATNVRIKKAGPAVAATATDPFALATSTADHIPF